MNEKDILNTVMTVVDETVLKWKIAQSLAQRAPLAHKQTAMAPNVIVLVENSHCNHSAKLIQVLLCSLTRQLLK